jgi:hypothetical protein
MVFAISTVTFLITLPLGGVLLKRLGYGSPTVDVSFNFGSGSEEPRPSE